MSYQPQLRRKAIVYLIEAIRDRNAAKFVSGRQPPHQTPSSGDLPAVFIALATETSEWTTNEEKTAEIRLAVFCFCWSSPEDSSNHIELEKVDLVDATEEAILSLMLNSEFRSEFVRVDVDGVDYTPAGLAEWGIPVDSVLSPFGAARIDARITVDYDAL